MSCCGADVHALDRRAGLITGASESTLPSPEFIAVLIYI